MAEEQKETVEKQERLCSEIQLFDLCELDSCRFKSGKFCSNEALLAKFEAIQEDDSSSLVYDESEMEDEDFDPDEEPEFDDDLEE